MDVALVTAKRSTCVRRQVGCVLLNAKGHVLATGYNGVASGLRHCNDVDLYQADVTSPNACPGAEAPSGQDLDGCLAIHAEQNALLQCSDPHEIHACYVTASPCVTCTKLLMNTSCQKIFFRDAYSHPQAERMWVNIRGRAWTNL